MSSFVSGAIQVSYCDCDCDCCDLCQVRNVYAQRRI